MNDQPQKPCVIDPWSVPVRTGSTYPQQFAKAADGREKRQLGNALGLDQFGVNLVRLPPGCWSSQRHWHSAEDEFVYVLEGELVLITDVGEQPLRAGMASGFPAGKPDGHHMINRSDRDAVYLEVGTRKQEDVCDYPDIDLRAEKTAGKYRYVHKNGTGY